MDENEKLIPVYVNECGELDESDVLKISGVGLQLAQKLAATRQQEPLSAPIMADIMGRLLSGKVSPNLTPHHVLRIRERA